MAFISSHIVSPSLQTTLIQTHSLVNGVIVGNRKSDSCFLKALYCQTLTVAVILLDFSALLAIKGLILDTFNVRNAFNFRVIKHSEGNHGWEVMTHNSTSVMTSSPPLHQSESSLCIT